MAFAYQEGYYFKPRVDYAILQKYSEGLIVSTACVGGHIPTLLRHGEIEQAQMRTEWFLNTFGPDRFFYELAPADFDKQVVTNKLLLDYGQQWGVKSIATSDAHYLHKQDHEAHEVLLSVQTKDQLSNPDRFSFGDCRVYVRTEEEMRAAFSGQDDLIYNTGFIADQCDFAFEFDKLFFPQFPVPEVHTQETYFEKLCWDGLTQIKQDDLIPREQYDAYDARLKLEIDLIIKMGYVGYFLVVGDFIQWAKRQAIPVGPGRGSAAGALVAWALQITNVDPLRYNLLFERFLNPERVSMPDIDIDFCIERREDVINYVKDKYGHDCVCQIITFGTMMAKGVIKDVARVLGFPFQDANAITDLIPEQLKITLEESIEQEPRLKELIDSNPKVKKLFDICFKLEGLTRHASKHAAGVVISPESLAETLPLYIPSKTTDLVAQYAMTELEAIGFFEDGFFGA
jgi:DNA polymerase-3 subunit alpha